MFILSPLRASAFLHSLGQELPRHLTGGATAMPPILLQNLNVFADGVRPGDFAVAFISLPR
jgi:hypothetical protein